jgi:hypothetical protein
VRSVLKRALGDDKAALLIDRILQGGDVSGIESLKWMDPLSVAELLRNEHPQIVAAILVHLEHEQAAAVLMQLPERLRSEVMLRVATLEGIQPTALKDLNEVLFKVLAGGDKIRKTSLGGVKTAAEIINQLGGNADVAVLDTIRNYDADLAQKIMDKMFVFDDLVKLDDRSLQLVLREVVSETLIVALKGGSMEVRDKILANMSMRASALKRRPGVPRPHAPVRSGSAAEGNPEGGAPSGRRRPDHHRRRCRRQLRVRTGHDKFHPPLRTFHPQRRDRRPVCAPLAVRRCGSRRARRCSPCTSWPR